jgi:hypothetical protein
MALAMIHPEPEVAGGRGIKNPVLSTEFSGELKRAGHQTQDTDGASIAPSGQTGIATWILGNDGNLVVLSAADISVVYTPVNTFGSTGLLATPVVTDLQSQRTVVQQDTRCRNAPPPVGNSQQIIQLAIIQGSNTVLLSQANCSDLASQLNTIGST